MEWIDTAPHISLHLRVPATTYHLSVSRHLTATVSVRGAPAGSSTSVGNSTSFADRNGRFDGTAIRNSNGTTSLSDRNGHFTGSTVNTTPRR